VHGRCNRYVLLALSFAFSCSGQPTQTDRVATVARATAAPAPREIVIAQGSETFPDDGLSDWVSYADGVVVGTVKSERQLPFTADVVENKEGYVGRIVELVVDEVLWRSSASTAELNQNDVKEMLVFGWAAKEDRLIPMSCVKAPRLEVGGQYIMPLVQFKRGWAPLTAASVTAVTTSDVATRDASDRDAELHAKDLDGRTFAEVAAMLSSIAPDELANDNRTLPPEERIQAVLRLRNPNLPEHPPNVPVPTSP
jgi:hypothetical protein